jgi:hypothetical protein
MYRLPPGRFSRIWKRRAARLMPVLALWWSINAVAQSVLNEPNADVERETENPVTHFYTLPLRYRTAFEDGSYGQATNSVEISNAVVPVPLGDDWFLIARSKAAFLSQAPKSPGKNWEDGFNNAQTTLFLSPARGNGFYWGVGPVVSFPSATTGATDSNQWGTGPSLALAWQRTARWTVALVANNVWTVGSIPGGTWRSSNLLLNPIVSYRFGDGWSVSSSPNITANWTSDRDNRWTLPIGVGIGKAFKLGAEPVTLKFESYYNAIRPDRASSWAAQLTLTFQFAR